MSTKQTAAMRRALEYAETALALPRDSDSGQLLEERAKSAFEQALRQQKKRIETAEQHLAEAAAGLVELEFERDAFLDLVAKQHLAAEEIGGEGGTE